MGTSWTNPRSASPHAPDVPGMHEPVCIDAPDVVVTVAVALVEPTGMLQVDYLAQTMRIEQMPSWLLYCQSLFDVSGALRQVPGYTPNRGRNSKPHRRDRCLNYRGKVSRRAHRGYGGLRWPYRCPRSRCLHGLNRYRRAYAPVWLRRTRDDGSRATTRRSRASRIPRPGLKRHTPPPSTSLPRILQPSRHNPHQARARQRPRPETPERTLGM